MRRLVPAFLLGAIGCAGLAAAVYSATDRLASFVPQTPDVQVADAETYILRSTQATGTCDVVRGDPLTGGRSRLSVDPSCAAVMPGVEKAKYWVDKDDGSVAFTENGIDPIVTFAVADGVAYESLKPAQPVLSLDADVGEEASE